MFKMIIRLAGVESLEYDKARQMNYLLPSLSGCRPRTPLRVERRSWPHAA
jgi:hypothetical protein